MNRQLSKQVRSILSGYQKHRRLTNILLIATIFVAAGTGLMLSMPASTATPELVCTRTDHTHTEECYEQAGTLKSQSTDKMTAAVSYDAGVIHENTVFSAKLLSTEESSGAKQAEEKVEEALNHQKQTSSINKIYDLSLSKDDRETEPEGRVSVVMEFETPVQASDDSEEIIWHLYHFEDDEKLVELTGEKTTDITTDENNAVTKITFETESFSSFILSGAVTVDTKKTESDGEESEDDSEEPAAISEANAQISDTIEEPSESSSKNSRQDSESDRSTEENEKNATSGSTSDDSRDTEKSKDETKSDAATDNSTKGSVLDPEKYPAQTFSGRAGFVSVSVSADPGALPADSTMKVNSVWSRSILNKVKDAADKEEKVKTKAVDISFYDANGEEIQPNLPIQVRIKTSALRRTDDITVVHVNDNGSTDVISRTSNQFLSAKERAAANEVIFDADSFSVYGLVYTVDFNYGEYSYRIDGEGSVLLSELLEQLHIYKNQNGEVLTVDDIKEASFSDETLVTIQKQEDDWKLTSLEAFQTEESLTLTLNDDSILTISVTDALDLIITDVTLEVGGQTYDLSKTSEINIKDNDVLKFTMDFQVPPYSLDDHHHTVEYQLPNGIKISAPVTGQYVLHNNDIVGTYSITTDGKIIFEFNDDYVHRDEEGHTITGDITFTGSVDVSDIPDGGSVPIKFSDELNININVEKSEVGDLSVFKQEVSNHYDNGYVEYQVTVSSNAGTSKEITLKDVLTTSGLDVTSIGNFTISPNHDDIQPIINGTSGFGVTLPQLDADSKYTISYRVYYDKTTVPLNGVSLNNKISGTSEASKGTKLTPSHEVNTNVKPNEVISKYAKSYDTENNTITWEVKINGSKANLKGWTLKDTLNGQAYKETVTVSPAINGKTEITLPYTWEEDDDNTYTITYTSSGDKLIGQSQVINNASLEKGKDSISTGDVGGGEYKEFDPLEKDAVSLIPNSDYTEAVINWTVTFDGSQGAIPADWTYADSLWQDQWFTGTQLKNLKSAIDQSLKDADLKLNYSIAAYLMTDDNKRGDLKTYEQIDDNVKYKEYVITFTSDLPKGSSFTFNYQSTAPLEDITKNTALRNYGYLRSGDKTVYDHGSIVYKPPKEPEIIKTDGSEANDTSHDIKSLDETFKWDLKVTIPENYTGTTLTIKEHLPTGISLEDLEILAQGDTATIFGATHFEHPKTGTNTLTINGLGGPYTIDLILSERSDGGIDATITLPEKLVKYNGKTDNGKDNVIEEVRFVVKVKPTDSSNWSKDEDGYLYKKFGNTVELIDKDKQTISSDSQSQTITLKDGNKLVEKSVGSVNSNVVPYTLKINEEGANLVEGSDTVTLTDILEYEYNVYYPIDVLYIRNSLHVYEMNEDGSKGRELSNQTEYSFTYEETLDEENKTNSNPTAVRTLKIVLPDSKALIVEYNYLTSTPDNAVRYTSLSNRAYLEGYSENRHGDKQQISIGVTDSSAHASVDGITLHKVDTDNFSVTLQGVSFRLYEYDPDSDSYVKKDKLYTTDRHGDIDFTLKDIQYETAYKLVEESTISGYYSEKGPYYFIVTDKVLKEGETAEYIAPDDFDGVIHAAGDSFYFKNRKIPEKGLSVQKLWKDYDGTVITDSSGLPEIIVRLLKDGEVIKTFPLNEANGWTEIFDDLDPEGNYTVEEATELVGYQTPVIIYEQGDGNEVSYLKGDSYGTATITNQPGTESKDESTSLAVTKKWVGSDGKTELTAEEIKTRSSDLTADVELVRYRQEEKEEDGTKLVFYACNGNSFYKYYADTKVVKQDSTVKLRFNIKPNYVSQGCEMYATTYDLVKNNTAPYNVYDSWINNTSINKTKLKWEIVTDGSDSYIEYTLPVASEDTIYLWITPYNDILSERTDTVAAEYLAGLISDGDPVLDSNYSQTVTLSGRNEWSAVFTNLPTLETVDGITYAYTYAVKETGCTKGFEFLSFNVGQQEELHGATHPISSTAGSIVITNQQKEEYELPKTGGAGSTPFILSGFSLMMISLLLLFRRRKPEEGRLIRKTE